MASPAKRRQQRPQSPKEIRTISGFVSSYDKFGRFHMRFEWQGERFRPIAKRKESAMEKQFEAAGGFGEVEPLKPSSIDRHNTHMQLFAMSKKYSGKSPVSGIEYVVKTHAGTVMMDKPNAAGFVGRNCILEVEPIQYNYENTGWYLKLYSIRFA